MRQKAAEGYRYTARLPVAFYYSLERNFLLVLQIWMYDTPVLIAPGFFPYCVLRVIHSSFDPAAQNLVSKAKRRVCHDGRMLSDKPRSFVIGPEAISP